jgi:2-haloacid dehalogenase
MSTEKRAATRIDRGRRRLMALMAYGAATLPLAAANSPARADAPLKAVAFDAFPIFDPGAVFSAAEAAVPDRDAAFWRDWFQKIFADAWLRTSARQYRPFIDVAAERLDYAFAAAKSPLDPKARDQILAAFSNLPAWPDVRVQLDRLRSQGIRLAFLSNMSEPTLRANMRRNGLEEYFETVLSTDRVQAFKPAPEAYALAIPALGLQKREIGFAAFAAWDAAGASWFGYPTAWVNRQAQLAEPGAAAVLTGRDLSIVAELVSN